MAQKGWLVNLDRCTGCHGCTIACKAGRFRDPEEGRMLRRFAVGIPQPVTADYFVPVACNHCLIPSCVAACPKGALVKEDNGIVTQRLDLCVGCRRCEWACPYGAIEFNDVTRKVTKCDMCFERQANTDGTWEDRTPWCVLTCAARAISVVDDFDSAETGDGIPEDARFEDTKYTTPMVKFISPDDISELPES